MIQLTHGTASETIIVTLTEKMTLTSPYVLFVFTHVSTKTEVTKIFAPGADLSIYPERYNKYTVATATLFLNKPEGMWNYRAYEQVSSTNTDPDLATTLIESGKMILKPATPFEFDEYSQQQTYTQYNG